MTPDRETAEQLRQGTLVREMVNGEGWLVAKQYLYDLMTVNDSVSSIVTSGKSLEEIGKEAMVRAHAIAIIENWIDAVEGRVEQHHQQSALLAEKVTEEIVRTYGG